MSLADREEFEDISNFIKDTQEFIEQKLDFAASAVTASRNMSADDEVEKTKSALGLVREALAYYEQRDRLLLASFRHSHCHLQPPTVHYFLPWWWEDLREGEDAPQKLNKLFSTWLEPTDRELLYTAVIHLKQLGDIIKERQHELLEQLKALQTEVTDRLSARAGRTGLSFLYALAFENTAAHVNAGERDDSELNNV
ncbi:MAG: hypothetical protein K0U37_00245 [Gammaproteobacteria bacterium]|nr:hypothetical protein [Gammaproteobacteria bacterium]